MSGQTSGGSSLWGIIRAYAYLIHPGCLPSCSNGPSTEPPPMNLHRSLLRSFLVFLMLFMVGSRPLLANDHGGAAAPEPLKFVVNLGDPARDGKYLQVQMVFEAASPEMEHQLAAYRPKIQHAMILLLSSQSAATLLTLQGKRDLMEHIIETVNHLLHETEKTGVKEVFFTSFIIQ